MQQWKSASDAQSELTYCVVTSSEKVRDAIAQRLQATGVKTIAITAQSSHTDQRGAIYLSTMHRAKGLEFDGVAVVAPLAYAEAPVEGGSQRQLLYVALTRAKRGALLALY